MGNFTAQDYKISHIEINYVEDSSKNNSTIKPIEINYVEDPSKNNSTIKSVAKKQTLKWLKLLKKENTNM